MLPYTSGSQAARQQNTRRALLLALLTVAIVAVGLGWLAANYAGSKVQAPVVTATSTATETGRQGAATPLLTSTPFSPPLPSATYVLPATSTPAPSATRLAKPTLSAPLATPTYAPTAVATPTASSASPTPASADMTQAEQSLLTLDAAAVPGRDLYAITQRLRLKTNKAIPHTTDRQPGNYEAGHKEIFYMSDILAKHYYTITATLQEVTGHVYWYVQDGQPVDTAALSRASQTFETQIYPTDRRLFGSEWTPGVDNDPRITVLFAPIAGAGGYFASSDEYTRAVNPFSNEREIIYINSSTGWEGVEGTLAHEFQHMIHWHENSHHDVWLNEGASVLATVLNGYDTVGVDGDFMRGPDVQLNAWQPNPDAARANYGASMLFLDYLRLHYGGDKALRSIVAAPGQGTDAIDHALTSLGSADRFTDVFKKWVVANLVDGQASSAEAGLDYADRDVEVSPQVVVQRYPKSVADTVSQFGADYIELTPPSGGDTVRVAFSGQPEAPVIAAPAHSGDSIWWSNRGDLADSTMTRRFDLRGLHSATLLFYTWYNTEQDLDYGYVEASSDNGATWTPLKGRHTTSSNPNGSNLGNAYTGKSADSPDADPNGWLAERVDLSPYAGKEALLRFEYITDDGYNAGGVAVDDIAIPELGYKDDVEREDGWQGEGFARLANKLPQTYYLAVVKFKDKGFDVQPVQVSPAGSATFDITGLSPVGPYNKAVLIICGTTPHTILPAHYELNMRAK